MKSYIKIINEFIFYTLVTFLLMLLSLFVLLNKGLFLKSSINDYLGIKSEPFNGTVYPIEYVPNPMVLSFEQRKQHYDKIDSKHFIKIPKYDPNIFGRKLEDLKPGSKEYEETIIQRLIYTIPYLSTYKFDYQEYSGSHPGVDIIAPKGTPIKAIANGVVVEAKIQTSNFGNYVYIRHRDVPLTDGIGTIYSLYGHMNKIFVKPGTVVKKGDLIGEVGDTGLATTDHLHFQIDLDSAPFKAYWPFSSNEMRRAGVNFFEAVNMGLGKENAKKYTINPFRFINRNLDFIVKQEEVDKKEEIVVEIIEDTKKEDTTDLVKKEENIDKSIVASGNVEVENFLDKLISDNEEKPDFISNLKTSNVPNIDKSNDMLLSNERDFMLLSNIEIALAGSNVNLLKSGFNLDEFEKVDPIKSYSDDIINIDENNNIENITTTKEEKLEEENLEEEKLEKNIKEEDENIKEEKNKTLDKLEENNYLFKDIYTDYKYINELKYFIENKYISGFEDKTFRPLNNITRAEALKILLLSKKLEISKDNTKYFKDVDENSWINNYVGYAIKAGLINNNGEYFNPNNYISRVEFVKLYALLNDIVLGKYENSKTDISDVLEKDWQYKYMSFAFKNNLFELDFGNIYPHKTLSREELIKILY